MVLTSIFIVFLYLYLFLLHLFSLIWFPVNISLMLFISRIHFSNQKQKALW